MVNFTGDLESGLEFIGEYMWNNHTGAQPPENALRAILHLDSVAGVKHLKALWKVYAYEQALCLPAQEFQEGMEKMTPSILNKRRGEFVKEATQWLKKYIKRCGL